MGGLEPEGCRGQGGATVGGCNVNPALVRSARAPVLVAYGPPRLCVGTMLSAWLKAVGVAVRGHGPRADTSPRGRAGDSALVRTTDLRPEGGLVDYGDPVAPASVGLFRLVRAVVVAGVVLALGVGAHRLGGGALPGARFILALGALALAGTSALAGRRFTVPVLTSVLGAGQVMLHGALMWLAPVACVSGAAPGPLLAPSVPMVHGGGSMVPVCMPAAVMSAHATMSVSPAMVAAHVAATAVSVLVISVGERALWWFLAWLRPLVETAASVDVHAVRRPALSVGRVSLWRRRSGYLRTSPRRGPPLRAVAPSALLA